MTWKWRRRDRRPDTGPSGLGLWWTFAAGLVLAAAIIVAIVQNSDRVRLHYLTWDTHVSLIVVVLTTALTAILLDEAGGLVWRRRRRSRLDRHSELEQRRAQQPGDEVVTAPASAPLGTDASVLPAPLPRA